MSVPSKALPEVPPEVRQHSQQLVEILKSRIVEQGSISFADYMQSALYEPGLGYYASGYPVFGADGDFVTAPGLGELYAKCLALQCDEVITALENNKSPTGQGQNNDEPCLIEFGAGNGFLARVLLEQITTLRAKRNQQPLAYHIIETSGSLRQRQQTELARLAPDISSRVQWHERLPENLSGVVIANEVLDAMPVERLRWQQQQLQQLRVEYDVARESLTASYVPVQSGADAPPWLEELTQLLATLPQPLADGYCFEFNTYVRGWLAAIADMLSSGAVLLVDYGYPRVEYFLPERDQGTLMCYFRHHAHDDPYYLPGAQDITAHVDFTAVVEAAVDAGFNLNGYTSQSAFLQANDLLGFAEQSLQLSSNAKNEKHHQLESLQLMQEVKTLCLPGSMGDRFQVMGLTKGLDLVMQGFTRLDLSHRL